MLQRTVPILVAFAAALVPAAAVAQTAPVPPVASSAPAPPAPEPQLTRIYRGDDGGALYLRADGTKVTGFAEHPGLKYAFVFRGTRTDNIIDGSWYDVAKGTRATGGKIKLKVFKNGDRLVRGGGADFGPDIYQVIDASQLSWPGAREAGFQARSRSDIDGAFIGQGVDSRPDGSRQYWRETQSGAYGIAEGPAPKGSTRPGFVSVLIGKRQANGSLTGEYFDVPKGVEMRRGTFAMIPLQFGRRFAFAVNDSGTEQPSRVTTKVEADYALDIDRIANAVDARFRNNVAGFAYAISHDGVVVRSGGGGQANREQKRAYTASTEASIASATKLVTATAVMRALDDRGLSVDTTVAKYFPSCWQLGPGMQSLTWRKLLDMSSGILRPSPKDPDPYTFQKLAAQGGLTGTKGYQNMNYAMLHWLLPGLLDKPAVEAQFAQHGCGKATKAFDATKDMFALYVRQVLYGGNVFASWKFLTTNRARFYNFQNLAAGGDDPSEIVDGSGGLKITARELGKFMAGLEHGRFVKLGTVQMMKDGELGFDDITGQGGPSNAFMATDGLGLADKKNGGAGSNGRGYGSQVTMFPGDVQIVAMVNSTNNTTTGGNATGLRQAWESGIR